MKLWLLRPKFTTLSPTGYANVPADWHKPWCDYTAGFVIRAETEHEARTLAQATAVHGDWSEAMLDGHEVPAWTSPDYSTCVELGPEGPAGIVMRDAVS